MGIKRCKAAFAVMEHGRPRMLNPGALVDESDPVVARNPEAFEDVETYVTARAMTQVEQATADPGEKRPVRRAPARKTTPKDSKTEEGS